MSQPFFCQVIPYFSTLSLSCPASSLASSLGRLASPRSLRFGMRLFMYCYCQALVVYGVFFNLGAMFLLFSIESEHQTLLLSCMYSYPYVLCRRKGEYMIFIGNENGNMFFWLDKHCNWLLVLIMYIFLLFCFVLRHVMYGCMYVGVRVIYDSFIVRMS